MSDNLTQSISPMGDASNVLKAEANRGWVGLIRLVVSLVTLISFFFLPWFSISVTCSGPDCGSSNPQYQTPSELGASVGQATGLIVATSGHTYRVADNGVIGGNSSPTYTTRVFSFPLLWGLVLVSVVLLVLSILVVLSKVGSKQGGRAIQILCGIALALEVIYWVGAISALSDLPTTQTSIVNAAGEVFVDFRRAVGTSFGFWLAVLPLLGGMVFWLVRRRLAKRQ